MSRTVSAFVDYALRRIEEDQCPKEETRQITYRAPASLVAKLDAIAMFLGVTRTAFMTEALELTAEEAISSIEDNLIFAKLKVNDLTIREFIEALERGENPRNAFGTDHNETNVRILK